MSFLLLDADSIINLSKKALLKEFLKRQKIIIGSIVAQEISAHPDPKKAINLRKHKQVAIENIALGEIGKIKDSFDPLNGPSVHLGEIEELIILKNKPLEQNVRFCTCDRGAIVAMAMLGLENMGMSLEKAVSTVNLQIELSKNSWSQKGYAALVEKGINDRAKGLRSIPW